MLPSKKPFLADEELGKKDDDHRLRPGRSQQFRPKQWRPPRPRRLLVGLVALYLLYLFFKNMPTDLPPAPERFNPAFAQARQAALQLQQQLQSPSLTDTKQGPPDRDDSDTASKNEHYYDGKINFYSLAKSLHRFQGQSSRYKKPTNHVVMFAAASLRSVSDLLPLACQMANRRVNEVHFVLMGRDDVSIEGIQRVNGLDDASCPVNWHGTFQKCRFFLDQDTHRYLLQTLDQTMLNGQRILVWRERWWRVSPTFAPTSFLE